MNMEEGAELGTWHLQKLENAGNRSALEPLRSRPSRPRDFSPCGTPDHQTVRE